MAQISEYLRSKGRIVMGWDEVTNSAVPEGMVVFGWRGNGEAALKAAQRGHRFVMTPAEKLYLIRYQGPQWFEPLTYFGNITLKNVYDYEPVGEDWPVEYQDRLMGIQGSMWTEFCNCPEDVAYQIFPRLAAVAEVAWSPAPMRDWMGFLRSLDMFNRHLDCKGVTYARSMFNIQHSVRSLENGFLSVSLECERPDVVIRYTTDGTEPQSVSQVYEGKMTVGEPVVIKAATFFPDGRMAGKVLELPVGRNMATACKVRSGVLSSGLLVNGVRGSLKQTDSEWCHFFGDASLVVDLGKVIEVNKVVVGTLNNYGMAFHRPSVVSLHLSLDGVDYLPVSRRGLSRKDVFCEGHFREDMEFSFVPQMARYVKINATHPGKCPKGHIREGQHSKFCFDEIIVKGEPSLYGSKTAALKFTPYAGRDTSSVRRRMSEKAQQNLIRWSTTGGL